MSFESAVVSAGLIGQVIFFSRFVVQWIHSEKEQKSVMPMSFWYFSLFGSFILLGYAVIVKDPVYIVGQGTGFVIYLRNLYFIYLEKGVKKSTFAYFTSAFIFIYFAVVIALAVFAPSIRDEQEKSLVWTYFLIGIAGQGFFFLRFFVQWLSTEKYRRSVIPVSFWYFSVCGCLLVLIYSILVSDIVFIFGQSVSLIIYLRNLYFIYKGRTASAA